MQTILINTQDNKQYATLPFLYFPHESLGRFYIDGKAIEHLFFIDEITDTVKRKLYFSWVKVEEEKPTGTLF